MSRKLPIWGAFCNFRVSIFSPKNPGGVLFWWGLIRGGGEGRPSLLSFSYSRPPAQFTASIADALMPGGTVFIQSDVLPVACRQLLTDCSMGDRPPIPRCVCECMSHASSPHPARCPPPSPGCFESIWPHECLPPPSLLRPTWLGPMTRGRRGLHLFQGASVCAHCPKNPLLRGCFEWCLPWAVGLW